MTLRIIKFHKEFSRIVPRQHLGRCNRNNSRHIAGGILKENLMSCKLLGLAFVISMGCSGLALAQNSYDRNSSTDTAGTPGMMNSSPNGMSNGTVGTMGNKSGNCAPTTTTQGSMSNGNVSSMMSGVGDMRSSRCNGMRTPPTGGITGSVGAGSGGSGSSGSGSGSGK